MAITISAAILDLCLRRTRADKSPDYRDYCDYRHRFRKAPFSKCFSSTLLAYGWRAVNLNWPIRIQQAAKNLVSSRQCKLTGKALKSGIFSHWRWHEIFTKGIYNSQNHITLQKVKNMKPTSNLAPKMVVPRASPGRIIVALFWTKYAVHRQIKFGIL